MTTYINGYEDEELDDINASQALAAIAQAKLQNVHISELPNEVRKTNAISSVIRNTDQPRYNDRIPLSKIGAAPVIPQVNTVAANTGIIPSQVNLGSIFDLASSPAKKESAEDAVAATLSGESMQTIDEAREQLEIARRKLEDGQPVPPNDQEIIDELGRTNEETIAATATPFPYLAREIMYLGLKMEDFHTQKRLNKYKKEGDELKTKIDLLLKLSAQLPKITSEESSYELKEDAKTEITRIAEELRAKGVDIFPGSDLTKKLTKEQLAAANSLINHHIDTNRTSLQELFTTKISVSIQFLQMMTEVMKKVAECDKKQKDKALERS